MEFEQEVVISAPSVDEAIILGLARMGLTRDDADVEVLDEGSKGFLGLGMREARVRVRKRLQAESAVPVAEAATAATPAVAGVTPAGASVVSELMPGVSLAPAGSPVDKLPLETVDKKALAAKPQAEGPQSEKLVMAKPEPGLPARKAHAATRAASTRVVAEMVVEDQKAIEAVALDVAEHFFAALDLQVTVDWREEDGQTLWISVRGKDADVLVGPQAQTLDSIQYLLRTVVRHKVHTELQMSGDFDLLLDADGYRERRMRSLATLARNTAEKAVKLGKPIQLRPMSAADRRMIHITLRADERVRTQSSGAGHSRAVTVIPVGPEENQ